MAMRGRPRKLQTPLVATVTQGPSNLTDDNRLEVRCITHNVHLGDETSLDFGDIAFVDKGLADFLIARGQVRLVSRDCHVR